MGYKEERQPQLGVGDDKCLGTTLHPLEERPSLRLNLVCLCLPSFLIAVFSDFGFRVDLFGQNRTLGVWLTSLAVITYFLILPIALLIVIVSQSPKAKSAAKRALVGFVLPIIVISTVPSLKERTEQRSQLWGWD